MSRILGLSALVIVGIVAGQLFPPQASAVSTLYWDSNGPASGIGGTGDWDTSTSNWSTTSKGTDGTQVWTPNDGTTAADLRGTAGTVTLQTPITADTLTIHINDNLIFQGNYVVAATGANTLTLTGNRKVLVDPGMTATISAPLVATTGVVIINSIDCLTKPTYCGALTLSGNNSGVTGGMTVYSGTVIAANSNALGASTSAFTLGSILAGYTSAAPGELDLQGGITLAQTQANMKIMGNIRNLSGTNAIPNGVTLYGTFAPGGVSGSNPTQLDCNTLYADGGTLQVGQILDSIAYGYASSTFLARHTLYLAGSSGTGELTGGIYRGSNANRLGITVTGGAQWIFDCVTGNSTNAYGFQGPTLVSGGNLRVKEPKGLGLNNAADGTNANAGETMGLNETPGATVSNSGTLDLYGITTRYPITLNGGSLINSSSAATTLGSVNCMLAVVPTSGGSGYTAPTVTFGSGSGTATASLGLIQANMGTISGGTCYHVGDLIGVRTTFQTTGAYAWITVTDNGTDGGIHGWTLTDPGAGFDATHLPVSVANARGGTSATITGATANYQVTLIRVTNVGSYTSAPSITIGGDGSGAQATAWLNGGITLIGASNQIGGAGDLTDCAPITGTGGFTKIGADCVTLKVMNTYSGATGINSGTLILGTNYAVPSTSAVTLTGGALAMGGYTDCVTSLALSGGNVTGTGTLVVQGGKLSGVGSISPVLKLLGGANLSPGFSPGSVTLGRASFGSSADNYTVDINGLGVANYDNVLFKVAMTLNSASIVINDLNYKASAALNDKFYIMDSDNSATGAAVSGTFNGLAQGATVYGTSGIGYTVNYNLAGDPKGTSNDVALTTLSMPSVPEPATLFLMGTGALGVVAFIRRQRMK